MNQAEDDSGIPSPGNIPRIGLLLPQSYYRNQLVEHLGKHPLDIADFDHHENLSERLAASSLHCLVLSFEKTVAWNGGAIIEHLKSDDITGSIPLIALVEAESVSSAVRAMRARALVCYDYHTPVPILVNSIRRFAVDQKKKLERNNTSEKITC